MVQKTSVVQQARRGRPRQYDPDSALARAAAAFWKNGYAGTSLDDLAAATGMNRPSLYAAFGDKRDLYLKTLERYQQQSRALSAQLLADSATLREFLTRFYDGALELYRAGEAEARGCYSISTAPAATAAGRTAGGDPREPARAPARRRRGGCRGSGKARDAGSRGERDPSALAESRPRRYIPWLCVRASGFRGTNSRRSPRPPST
jgi:AcrR family transcriptional regulator